MANARKLTEAQIVALRAAAKGERIADAIAALRAAKLAGRREKSLTGFRLAVTNTIEALKSRGLIELPDKPPVRWAITPAGRAALFEATGEHAPTLMEKFDEADARAALDAEKKRGE